jgi:ABC-type uncharacterized transport system substrate-binding protein
VAAASSRAWRGPGGNIFGFASLEFHMSGNELLKEIAPKVKRAIVIRNPTFDLREGQ